MSNGTSSFKMGQEYEIIIPKKAAAYAILVPDWEYLKKKIRRIATSNLMLQNTGGSALLGVAASALVAAITLPAPIEAAPWNGLTIVWAVFVISLICGGVILWYAKKEQGLITNSKDDVLEEMERLENKYKIDDAPTTESGRPAYRIPSPSLPPDSHALPFPRT